MKYVRTQWDRTAAVAATALALIVLLLGYLGTSGTEFIAAQIPYLISGGLFGIVLLTIGAVLWISADLRDEWRELTEQGAAIREEQIERRSQVSDLIQAEVKRQLADLTLTAAVPPAARSTTAVRANGRASGRP